LGFIVHATAGFVNPGWDGHLTLELSNVGKLPIALYPGMRVAQISFMQLTSPAKNAYGSKKLGSKYNGKEIPEESKIQKEF
jgi:dCTP deaminase